MLCTSRTDSGLTWVSGRYEAHLWEDAVVSGQNATAPLVFKSLPFNPSTDFRMVSTLSNFDFIIVVDRASPLRSIADLVTAARSAPGRFNFGTISSGSLQNLMSHLFVARAD